MMTAFKLEKYLAQVSAVIRKFGWISSAESKKRGAIEAATHRIAWDIMSPGYGKTPIERNIRQGCEPTKEDITEAALAVLWLEELPTDNPEHDRDYTLAMKQVLGQGFVSPKNRGVAASILQTYRRYKNIPTERAMVAYKHCPVLKEFLDRSPDGLHHSPKVVIRKDIVLTKDGKETDLHIRRASKDSVHRGSYYFSDGLPREVHGLLFGRLDENGYYFPTPDFIKVPLCIALWLDLLNDNPGKWLGAFGKDHKYCPFCDRDLSGQGLINGYTKTCAERYNLPFDNSRAKLAASVAAQHTSPQSIVASNLRGDPVSDVS